VSNSEQFLRPTLIQIIILGLTAPVILFQGGKPALVSFVSGAMCALLPQAYFALRMAQAAKLSAARAARMGLAAEGGKFLLSAVFFALVFAVLKPAHPGMVFLGFGVLWLAQMIAVISLLRAR
jgi:ATP synthase protein I